MTAGRPRKLDPMQPWGALFMLFLVFPGVFLPIDLIYALGGVTTYATPDQGARIFLYALALSIVASLVCCVLCLALGVVARAGRGYDAGTATFAAHWMCVALAVFALGHGLLLWSSYFIHYDPDLRWLRELALLMFSAAAGWIAARRRAPALLAATSAVLRASAFLVTAGALGSLAVAALATERAPAVRTAVERTEQQPSIFLITIDTLSALHMPMYGYPRPTTPRLAEFAQGATVFLRHYASSNFTTASVGSLLFGHRPWALRVNQLEGRPLERLRGRSLPALLQEAGYVTAAVATNAWASPRHLRIEEHFAVLSDHRICLSANPAYALDSDLQAAIQNSLLWNELSWFVMRVTDLLGTCEGGHFDPELAFSEARRVLAEAPSDRPIFLWIHLLAPHDPYVAPKPFVGAFNSSTVGRDRMSTIPPYLFEAAQRMDFPGVLRDRYDESIRLVDHHVGAFLDELKRQGRYDDAFVVVTADHGESFSKGYGHHGGPMLHEELVRVPLLIKEPRQRASKTVSDPTELVDLKPTLLALLGLRADRDEGISLLPAIAGGSLDRPVFTMNFQQSQRLGPLDTGSVAMVRGQWKYVHYFGRIRYPAMPHLKDALYDLADDPWETRDLAQARPDIASQMQAEIVARVRMHGARIE